MQERVQASISSPELARASVGISLADALCARTGSILIRSHTAGGRRLSVMPAVHIVLAKESQIVPTLSPWLAAIVQDDAWSMGTIISGPSRTADIEKILVLGAHGPKRVIVILFT